jgi:hypothetical protein
MKKSTFMILAVIGLSGIMLVGGTLVTIPVQPSYSSSEQQTDDEQQTEPEVPQEEVPGTDEQQEPQAPDEQQIPTDTEPLGTANQSAPTIKDPSDVPAPEREICVTNANGQRFCYKELKPDEACLKPMNEEDPPFCPTPNPESIANQTTGTESPTNSSLLNETGTVNATNYTSEATSSGGGAGDPIPDIGVKLGSKPR